MCGISGFFGKKNFNPKVIGKTLKLMSKRGPDSQNYVYRSFSKTSAISNDSQTTTSGIVISSTCLLCRLSIESTRALLDPESPCSSRTVASDFIFWRIFWIDAGMLLEKTCAMVNDHVWLKISRIMTYTTVYSTSSFMIRTIL